MWGLDILPELAPDAYDVDFMAHLDAETEPRDARPLLVYDPLHPAEQLAIEIALKSLPALCGRRRKRSSLLFHLSLRQHLDYAARYSTARTLEDTSASRHSRVMHKGHATANATTSSLEGAGNRSAVTIRVTSLLCGALRVGCRSPARSHERTCRRREQSTSESAVWGC